MELEGIYTNLDHETCSKCDERGLDRDKDIYANKDQNLSQSEARAQNYRGLPGGSKCVVLSTLCFGLMCVLLVAAIIVLYIKLTAEREMQATHMLQTGSRYQTEKDQLQDSFNSLSQKKLELETRVKDLTAEKSLLETRVKDLTAEKSQLQNSFNSSSQKKLELETRVKDLTAEKSLLETRVKDLTAEKSQLQNSFNSSSQKKLELETRVKDLTAEKSLLETRVKDLTAEKSQLQGSINSLKQKNLELESSVTSLREELNREASKQGFFFISNEEKSWSESRQYCRDRGGDLVIINTEVKQRFISSLVKEYVWIGLSDIEKEGKMKWVDNSPLKQGFWEKNEPNDAGGNEDCIELNPAKQVLNNWNDIPCSLKRKWVCEN